MWSTLRTSVRNICSPLSRSCHHGYSGGCPGVNLPWSKGMHNPMRFTLFWVIIGTVGFGAPWLVVRHQMLRNTGGPPPEPKSEEEHK
ncbi:cytochrome c oxidase subunit 7C, mitochondrial [Drosophila guanche]|uniref:cytochrome c oxidase subunit 7C, mitochondrial n=1 Tax=Drosophila guanche TaxID=7266 RepID=UPI0014717F2D|nr:cytochrome c oxidase subunit 7C, mitochondrial [Drosophila guanche]